MNTDKRIRILSLSVFICVHLWLIPSSIGADFTVHIGEFAGAPIVRVQLPNLVQALAQLGLRERPVADLQSVAIAMKNLNRGNSPILPMNLFPPADIGRRPWPIDRLMSLIARTAGPGFRPLRIAGESDHQIAIMLLGPESQMTIYLLNPSGAAARMSIQELPIGKAFRQQIWNGHGQGATKFDRNVIVDLTGRIQLNVAARSMVALSAK